MPKLIECPSCGYTRSWTIRRHHRKCKQCRKEWSPGTQFLISNLRLNQMQWKNIIKSFLQLRTIVAVKNDCKISYGTAQKVVLLLRKVMTSDAPPIFDSLCETDETYIGGAWKNKAIHIRRQGSLKGRGTSKQPIFGIISRSQRLVRTWLVPNTQLVILFPLIKQQVAKGNTIYTDGCQIYRYLPYYGYQHAWVNHEQGEYVRGDVHTQTIDGYWGLLKTHLDSIGGIRKNHAHLYAGEFQWRYNHRSQTLAQKTEQLINLLKKFGGRK